MKKTVRILALVLTALMCFMAFGCSKPSKNEVLDAFKELYPKAALINGYVYGAGLPYDGEYNIEELDSPHYVAVSDSSPYKSIAELEAAVLEVYSEGYYTDVLKAVLFAGVSADGQGLMGISPRYKEVNGVLYTDVTYSKLNLIRCDAEKAYIVEIKSRSAIVGAPRSGQTKDKNSTMVLTDKGWRFDFLA